MPTCKNCGKDLPSGTPFCPTCGALQTAEGTPPSPVVDGPSTTAGSLASYGAAPPAAPSVPTGTGMSPFPPQQPTGAPPQPAAPAASMPTGTAPSPFAPQQPAAPGGPFTPPATSVSHTPSPFVAPQGASLASYGATPQQTPTTPPTTTAGVQPPPAAIPQNPLPPSAPAPFTPPPAPAATPSSAPTGQPSTPSTPTGATTGQPAPAATPSSAPTGQPATPSTPTGATTGQPAPAAPSFTPPPLGASAPSPWNAAGTPPYPQAGIPSAPQPGPSATPQSPAQTPWGATPTPGPSAPGQTPPPWGASSLPQQSAPGAPPPAAPATGWAQPGASGAQPPYGAPAPYAGAGATPPPRKKSKLMPVLIIVGVVVVLAGVFAALWFLGVFDTTQSTIDSIIEQNDALSYTYYTDDPYDGDTCLVLPDGSSYFIGEDVYTYDTSTDMSTVVYTVKTNDDDYDSRYDLYMNAISASSTQSATLIAEDVISYRYSPYTKALYYLCEEATDTLYLYQGGASQKLASDVESYAFSTNDKYVLYISGDTLYSLTIGKEPVEQAASLYSPVPLGVSADGKRMFYLEYHSSDNIQVTCLTAGGETQTDGIAYNPNIYLNYNCDEMLVAANDSLWRYTAKAGFEEIAGHGPASYYDRNGSLFSFSPSSATVAVRLVKDFNSFFFSIADDDDEEVQTLYIKSGDADPEKIASGVEWSKDTTSYIRAARDGSVITYPKNESLYQAVIQNGKVESTEKIATGVIGFVVSADGQQVYYTTGSDETATFGYLSITLGTLYHWNLAEGESVEIADGVVRYIISSNGQWCSYLTDYDWEEREGTCFLYSLATGDPSEIATGAYFMPRLSNDGTLLYYTDTDTFSSSLFLTWYQGALHWCQNSQDKVIEEDAIF